MKIGLVNVDSKIPNLALMKLSAWHKSKGDDVKWWNAFESFEKIYASKIFTHTSFPYLPKTTIKGGCGFNLMTTLPKEIEHIYPDYGLYPIDYAMGYLTRGCINQCNFCVVPKKEGILHHHAELNEFWHGQKQLFLLDNALTDYRPAWQYLEEIRDKKIHLNLSQGFNVRTIQKPCAEILTEINIWRGSQWKIAWDNPSEEKQILNGIKILTEAGINTWKIMCYVLVNFQSTLTEDLHRIQILDQLGIDPFIMVFDRYNKQTNSIYSHLQRWCNRPQIRKSCQFKEYLKSKEIKLCHPHP
jgi:hypothetical protein